LTLVAVISDTHMPRGARVLPRACAERLDAADLILHAGDVVAASVLHELERFAPVAAVHGNMDQPDLVAALPRERVVEVDEARIGIVHVAGPALGREARLAAKFPGCAAVVYGHTHVPQVELHEGVWILNPGSPTERRRAPERTMLELRVDGGRLEPELIAFP
jgi:putative phosphoesterase